MKSGLIRMFSVTFLTNASTPESKMERFFKAGPDVGKCLQARCRERSESTRVVAIKLRRNMRAISRILYALALLFACSVVSATEVVTYYYTDAQGTILLATDAQGNTISSSDYRPYGAQALGMAAGGLGYADQVSDPETGLIYMQARYYDPEIGRLVGVDQAGFEISDTFGFNRYDYALNNPFAYVDPTGMSPEDSSGPDTTPLPPVTVVANRAPDIIILPSFGDAPTIPSLKRDTVQPESYKETMRIICENRNNGLIDRSGRWNDLNRRNAEHYYFGNLLGNKLGPGAVVAIVAYEAVKYPRYLLGGSTTPTKLGLQMGLMGAADSWTNGRSSPASCEGKK